MPYHPDVMPSQQVDYVGISASIDKGCMVWRHTAEKYDKIRRIIDLVARRVTTPRIIQAGIGYMIWDCMLALRHLCFIRHVIDLCELYSSFVKTPKEWDVPFHLEAVDNAMLIQELQQLLVTESTPYRLIRQLSSVEPRPIIRICVDASGAAVTGYGQGGYIIMSDSSAAFRRS